MTGPPMGSSSEAQGSDAPSVACSETCANCAPPRTSTLLDKYMDNRVRFEYKSKEATRNAKSSCRLRLQVFLEDPHSSRAAYAFSRVLSLAILAQVCYVVVASGSFDLAPSESFTVECVFSGFFTIELVLRTISFSMPPYRFILHTRYLFYWIDVVALLPFYVDLFWRIAAGTLSEGAQPVDDPVYANALGLAKSLRILRLVKITARNPDMSIVWRVLYLSWRAMLVPLTSMMVSALFLATIIYYVERLELKGYSASSDCDPVLGYPADERCPAFPDIGAAIWFMIVTYTSVGYGDVWPHSHSGKTVAVLAMVWGIIISAMPIAIVANAFSQAWEERTTSKVVLRVQKHCIEHGAQLHAIQELFRRCDRNATGAISFYEFRYLLSALSLNLTPSQTRTLFRVFDEDHTGVQTPLA